MSGGVETMPRATSLLTEVLVSFISSHEDFGSRCCYVKDPLRERKDMKIARIRRTTSAVDPEMVDEVLHVITNLLRVNMTTIVVSHETGFVQRVADRSS